MKFSNDYAKLEKLDLQQQQQQEKIWWNFLA